MSFARNQNLLRALFSCLNVPAIIFYYILFSLHFPAPCYEERVEGGSRDYISFIFTGKDEKNTFLSIFIISALAACFHLFWLSVLAGVL